MALFGRTVIVCRKAVDLFTDYLEDALPVRDRARLEAHLAGCPHCFEYLRQMRTTIDALGQVGPDTPSPETSSELIALYQRWAAHPRRLTNQGPAPPPIRAEDQASPGQ